MKRRVNILREFSVPLISGVVVALIWANLDPESYYRFDYENGSWPVSFHFIVNDFFMVMFFGIAAVEITKSCRPGGDLFPLRKAINPLFSTVGGVVGPVSVYLILNSIFGNDALFHGWGIPTATDIALAWLIASLVFGRRHPAVSFLLLLAIADDAIGLAIIAIFYPDPNYPVAPQWLALVAAGVAAAWLLNRFKVGNYWPYILLGGGLTWTGLFKAHLHPALALVFIVPFLPHTPRESKHLFEEENCSVSPLAKFEHEWKVLVDFGLFAFGLANAGVEFANINVGTWMVLSSLIFGKTCGIFILGWLAQRFGFPLPSRVGLKELLLIGLIAGIGLTVALFVASVAFTDMALQGAAKMGALFSAGSAILALALGMVLKVKRIT